MKPTALSLFSSLATTLLAITAAHAQTTYTWAPGGVQDVGGTWDTSTANWTTGPIAWPNNTSPGDVAQFGLVTTQRTVTVSGTIDVDSLQFSSLRDGFGQDWVFNGGTLNLVGSGLINPVNGQNAVRINSQITGSIGLTLDSSGSRNGGAETRLAGNNTYTGTTTVRDSYLALYSTNALGATGSGNNTVLESNGGLFYSMTGSNTYAAEDILNQGGNNIRFANGDSTLSGNFTLNRATSLGNSNQVGLDVRDNNRTVTWNGNMTTTSSDNSQTFAQILLSTTSRTNSKIIVNGVISDGLRADSATMQTRLLITGDSAGTSGTELNGNNSFTGAVTMRGGTLWLGHNNALGTSAGGVNFGDGGGGGGNTMSLLTTGAFTIGDSIAFQNANGGAYTAIVGGSHTSETSTYSGNIGWEDNAASTYRLTAATGGTVIFSGVIDDAARTKGLEIVGGGTIVFTNSNTYDGATTIASGTTLQLGNGSSTGQLATTSAINNSGTLVFNRSNDFTQGTHFASTIGGSGALVKNGSGILSLSGNNTSTAGFTINEGDVYVTHSNALGANSNVVTFSTLNSGTELRLNTGGLNIANPIQINASSNSNGVVLRNQVGTGTLSGLITLKNTGTGTINHNVITVTGTTLNIDGGIVADDSSNAFASRIEFTSGGTVNINGQINNSAGGRELAIQQRSGDSTVNWNSGASGSTMSGLYTLARGTLNIATSNPFAGGFSLASGASGASDNINLLTTAAVSLNNGILVNNNNSSGLTTVGGTHTSGTTIYTGFIGFQASRDLRLTAAAGGTVEFSGLISDGNHSGSLNKIGAGTVVLSRADGSTFDGGATISEGTLLVNNSTGSGTGTGSVTVNSGATLGGDGRISGNTAIAGTHAAGNKAIGSQTFTNNLAYSSGSVFAWEMNYTGTGVGTRGTNYDAVNVAGNLSGSDAIFRIVLPGSTTFNDSFWLNNREWTNIFQDGSGNDNASWASIFGSGFEYFNASGEISAPTFSQGNFTFSSGSTLEWQAIPEPTSALAGLLLAAGLLRRRRA